MWHEQNFSKRLILCVCVMLCVSNVAAAQEHTISWHAPGWKYRAIVLVPQADAESASMDVAQVRLDHAGATLPNADDVRIFDLAGNAVPYEVTYQDSARYVLISFQSPQQQSYRVIYFGNKAASADLTRTLVNTASEVNTPTPGPEAKGWQPRAGLVLATYARPAAVPSPDNMTQFTALLEQAKLKPNGADYRNTISDGLNPFGSSDNYVSVYRGWINLPESGAWRFSNASSNASFSFIDGQKLVHWPGEHHSGHGQHGEFNTTVTLERGLHYVVYFQERHAHRPLAFLGIAKPGQKRFDALSAVTVPPPRQARITVYETSDMRAFAMPRIEIQDAVLFAQPTAMSLTRVKLRAFLPEDQLDQWLVTWELGDGQSVSGTTAEHVYIEPGLYKVTMHASGSRGQRIAMDWPLDVYPDVNQPDDVQTVRANVYGTLLDAQDPKHYFARRAVKLALVLNEIDHHEKATIAAETALFMKDLPPEYLPAMLALAYHNAPASDLETHKLAAHFTRQIEPFKDGMDVQQRVQWLSSLVRITGTWQRDIAAAASLYASVETARQISNPSRELKDAIRQCALAMGDGYLMAGRVSEAKVQYALASSLIGRELSEGQMRTKSGMYPQQVNEQLEAGKPQMAMIVVERWQNEIPSDQLTGRPWFLAGKSYLLSKNPKAALLWLVPATKLLRGSADEAEAYWLTAESYRLAGEPETAEATVRELIRSGLTGEWVERAKQSLENKP